VTALREFLRPESEDDLGFRAPDEPSELRQLSDEELFRFWRKLAFGGSFPVDRMVEHEMAGRLILALKDFNRRLNGRLMSSSA
jgi:hypothetical protein